MFLESLRKRGLVDLLDLYLKENPPRAADARLLLQREILRARYADTGLPFEQRLDALREANAVLSELLRQKPRDKRALDWQLDLAWSQVFEEAEPLSSRLLYGGASLVDREALRTVMQRALTGLRSLQTTIDAEMDRIDKLPLADYERLEDSGYVTRLEQTIVPRTRYARLWALYFDALARPAGDDDRKRDLDELRAGLKAASDWLDKSNPLQPQTSLLQGMALRLAGEFSAAEEALIAASDGVRRAEPARQNDLGWVRALSWLERIRTHSDGGRFDDARRAVADARRAFQGDAALPPLAATGLALCERGVYRASAAQAAAAGRTADAQKYRAEGASALLTLLKTEPQRRDAMYAALYRQVGPDADPATLDAVERAALLAGLIRDADDLTRDAAKTDNALLRQTQETRARQLLTQAVSLVETITREAADPKLDEFTAEALFNGAAAAYRLQQSGRATTWFLKVARDCPTFDQAGRAALLAVQIASDLYRESAPQDRAAARDLYIIALETLENSPSMESDARYWRFFYAQTLEEDGRCQEAADQYALVDAAHPQALEARFLEARSRAAGLAARRRAARDGGIAQDAPSALSPSEAVTLRHTVENIADTLRAFIGRAEEAIATQQDAQSVQRLKNMIAEAHVIPAEIDLLPDVAQPQHALSLLDGLDVASFPTSVQVRAMRTRLTALVQLSRMEEMRSLLPAYVALDKTSAGATLQSLYDAIKAEHDDLLAAGRTDEAARRAVGLVLVARQLVDGAAATEGVAAPRPQKTKRQLAEALTLSGDCAGALEVLQSAGVALTPGGGTDPAAQIVAAEALQGAGRLDEALLLFNELARPGALPDDDPTAWRALMGDLRCRLALKQSPRDVLKVLDNRKALHPEMGGPRFAPRFESLRQECHKLLAPSAGP